MPEHPIVTRLSNGVDIRFQAGIAGVRWREGSPRVITCFFGRPNYGRATAATLRRRDGSVVLSVTYGVLTTDLVDDGDFYIAMGGQRVALPLSAPEAALSLHT